MKKKFSPEMELHLSLLKALVPPIEAEPDARVCLHGIAAVMTTLLSIYTDGPGDESNIEEVCRQMGKTLDQLRERVPEEEGMDFKPEWVEPIGEAERIRTASLGHELCDITVHTEGMTAEIAMYTLASLYGITIYSTVSTEEFQDFHVNELRTKLQNDLRMARSKISEEKLPES